MAAENGPDFDAGFRDRLKQLFAWRRDNRHFTGWPVAESLIDHLLDIACMAPSVGNSQPWRFVRIVSPVCRSEILAHVDRQVRDAGAIYSEDERSDYDRLKLHGLRQAPVWIAVYCDETSHTGRGLGRQTMPETLRYSVVMAVHTLWLAARAYGLGMGWVSILQPATLDSILDVPKGWHLIALLCLGWPETSDDTPELERKGWQERISPKELRTIC